MLKVRFSLLLLSFPSLPLLSFSLSHPFSLLFSLSLSHSFFLSLILFLSHSLSFLFSHYLSFYLYMFCLVSIFVSFSLFRLSFALYLHHSPYVSSSKLRHRPFILKIMFLDKTILTIKMLSLLHKELRSLLPLPFEQLV